MLATPLAKDEAVLTVMPTAPKVPTKPAPVVAGLVGLTLLRLSATSELLVGFVSMMKVAWAAEANPMTARAAATDTLVGEIAIFTSYWFAAAASRRSPTTG